MYNHVFIQFLRNVYIRAVLGMGDIKDEEKVGFHD